MGRDCIPMRATRSVAMQGMNTATLDTVLGKLWLKKAPSNTGARTTFGVGRDPAVRRETAARTHPPAAR